MPSRRRAARRRVIQGPTYESSPPTHRPVPRERRRSVRHTTARRVPSARKRPEAGALPAPASGRPRARRGRVGLLKLLRRTPRAVYRVYDEASYLAGAEAQVADSAAEEDPPAGPGSFPASALAQPPRRRDTASQRRRRAVGAAALVGSVAALSALAALDGVVSHRAQRSRREAARGRGPVATGPTLLGVRRALGRSRTRSRASREVVSSRSAKDVRSGGLARHRGPRSSRPAGTARGVVPTVDSHLLAASAAASGPPAPHAEFGFER